MSANPYKIYIDDLEIPVTPAEIDTKFSSKNSFYSLMNGETYTALRKQDLANWSFSFYAFSKPHPQVDLFVPQETIKNKLKSLKDDKSVFEFIVLRTTSDINLKNSMCKYMTLEDYSIKENADWGTNIKITLDLKEYKPLVTVKLEEKANNKAYKIKETKGTTIEINIDLNAKSSNKSKDISNGLLTQPVKDKLK